MITNARHDSKRDCRRGRCSLKCGSGRLGVRVKRLPREPLLPLTPLVVKSNALLCALMPMPTPSPKPIRDDYRRALAMLDASPYGVTEAILLAHGIEQDLLVELARDGFATVRKETLHDAKRTRTVFRLRITDTGRRALALLKGK
jgi:hypothetical protein